MVLEVVEALTLDSSLTVSKNYTIYAPFDWVGDARETAKLRVDVQLLEGEGRQMQLRAWLKETMVACELLRFDIVKSLLGYLEIADVLPTSMPLSSIQSTHTFLKYLIMPFVAVTAGDNQVAGSFKIQIWPKAPGLLAGMNLRLDFLDISGMVFLHHIESDQFRLLICDPVRAETVKLDLEMDYSTMDYFFTGVRAAKDDFRFAETERILKLTARKEGSDFE